MMLPAMLGSSSHQQQTPMFKMDGFAQCFIFFMAQMKITPTA
jgi:hypothetical protein